MPIVRKNITQTGPQSSLVIRQQNESDFTSKVPSDEFSKHFGDYKNWESYSQLRDKGYNDSQVSQMYQDIIFRETFKDRDDYDSLKRLSPNDRQNFLLTTLLNAQKKQSSAPTPSTAGEVLNLQDEDEATKQMLQEEPLYRAAQGMKSNPYLTLFSKGLEKTALERVAARQEGAKANDLASLYLNYRDLKDNKYPDSQIPFINPARAAEQLLEREEDIRKQKEAIAEQRRLDAIDEWYANNPLLPAQAIFDRAFEPESDIVENIGAYLRQEFDIPFRKKHAREYAREQVERMDKDVDASYKRQEYYKRLYHDLHASVKEPNWEWFSRVRGDGKIVPSLRTPEAKAEMFANEMEHQYQLDHMVIPQEKNPYATLINSKEDLQKNIADLSPVYYEFKNSEWLSGDPTEHNHNHQIDWDELYNLVKSDLKDGHVARASYNIDKYLSDEVIGKNQDLFSSDSTGHHGQINSSLRQFWAGAVQSGVEAATFIPSLAVGAVQATLDTSDLQLLGGMNWWERTVDNTIHNDWLGTFSNVGLADWADELQKNADVYSTSFWGELRKGGYTYGAMLGTVADMLLTRGGASAIRGLTKKGIKSIEHTAKKQIVSQGVRAKEAIVYDKAMSGVLQLKANYSEAVQQAIETERTIYRNANEKQNKIIQGIIENEFPKVNTDALPYTKEDIDYVMSQRTPEIQQYWHDYAAGKTVIPPEGYNAAEDYERMILEAKAKHIFNKRVPGYDDEVVLAAHIEAMTETQLATALLTLGDITLGGVDKALANFAMGKKVLNFSTLGERINTAGGFGKWATNSSTWKGIGKGALSQGKIAATETLTEMGQQSISALGMQYGDYTAENFLMNHLYGDGSLLVGATSYQYLNEIDPERFQRDAALGETVKQTLITTMLMPNVGYRGKVAPTARREGQSWLSNAVQQIHYYSPINTQLGNSIFNELAQNGQAEAFAAAINKYYSDPKNRAATTGTIAATNYAIQMMQDVANNNQVGFENHQTAKSIAEGIALSMIEGNEAVNAHREIIRNMANIKSANQEQQQKAIQDFREESKMNPAIAQMSDEEILNTIEESGKRINGIYDRVFEEQAKLDERYGRDRSNWQQRGALIFDTIAKENLEERIKEKQTFLNEFISSIANEDLGESTSSVEDIKKNGLNINKQLLLSGQDILRLAPNQIEALMSPKNREKLSDEQQQNIKKLEDILIEKDPDGKVKDSINRISIEQVQYERLRKEYREIFRTPNWTSKKVEKEAERVVEEFSPNKKAKRFQKKAIATNSVSELRALYNQEKGKNEERKAKKQFDVDQALQDIKDPDTQKRVAELNNIERAKNSLQNYIYASNLDEGVKESLVDQVDDLANNVEKANALYDIDNYNLYVRPDEANVVAGQLQDIINNAKSISNDAQNVNTNVVTEQKGATQNPEPANLGSRDVDTAPAVNAEPIEKLTIEEASEKITKANNFINNPAGNGFSELTAARDAATQLIEEVKTKCPEGYKVVEGGNGVALIKVNPKPVDTTVEVKKPAIEPKDDSPTFVPEENVTHEDAVYEEPSYEEVVPVDKSLDVYPDTDVRSVKKVALGKFSPRGKTFAFPIRDEQVDENTQVRVSYTKKERDNDGQEIDVTYTNTKNLSQIVSVEEYNALVAQSPADYMPLEDIVKNYPRPKFVNKTTNQEVERSESTTPTQNTQQTNQTAIDNSITRTNRTEVQQERLNNNITPARNEVAAQFLPLNKNNYKAEEEGREFERLGDDNYRNIDSQLEEQSAFEYRNSGRVQVGDEIQFVVSEEEMPNGTKQPVIWEVTKPKDKEIPEDSKFKGMQVLSVLDQTNMGGDRAALIDRIRKAYDEAGRPESFLYDKETFRIDSIEEGIIPFHETNTVESSSQATIESTNLKKGLVKSNGKWGIKFWNAKSGKMTHYPVIFKQLVYSSTGTSEVFTNPKVSNVKDVKHELTSQNPTREVTLVAITPTGYKSVHSVYVMKRDIENAVDKYIQAITNGKLGETLIDKMKPRLTSNTAKTSFSDFFRFNTGISERVVFYTNNGRLELGYTANGVSTTLVQATQIAPNKFVIADKTTGNIVNDNNQQGFTFDEIAKEYLKALVQDEVVGASLQINMQAITDNHAIADVLIEDGFLWSPNSINARFGMENTGFNASINNQNKPVETPKPVEKPKAEPKTAPVEKLSSEPVNKPKKKVTNDSKSLIKKVPRRKLDLEAATTEDNEVPTTPQSEMPQQGVSTENKQSSYQEFSQLTPEQQKSLLERKITPEIWNKLNPLERENTLNCI